MLRFFMVLGRMGTMGTMEFVLPLFDYRHILADDLIEEIDGIIFDVEHIGMMGIGQDEALLFCL